MGGERRQFTGHKEENEQQSISGAIWPLNFGANELP